MLKLNWILLILLTGILPSFGQKSHKTSESKRNITVPTLDISGDKFRQVVIAPGTKQERQGHPHTILLPDGKTIYAIWTIGHGGPANQLKKSEDGGLTWSALLEVPENWAYHANCPPLYLLKDPEGLAG